MTAAPPTTARVQPAVGRHFWRAVFLLLMAVECAPFWLFRYFPSQDGPSHLYNALVLAHYGAVPLFREYYFPTIWNPAGNLLTQLLLAPLLTFVSPLVAEKVVLSGYVVLLFLSFRYLLRALTAHADQFACFAALLAPNWFLFKGFYNFCYSVPIALFVIGYWMRRKHQWTLRSLAVLMFGGVTVYMAHVLSWVVCVSAIGLLGLPELIAALAPVRQRLQDRRGAILQSVLPLLALLPPLILLLIQLGRPDEPVAASSESLKDRIYYLYSLAFLRTPFESAHLFISKAVAGTLLLALLTVAAAVFWRGRYNVRNALFLALSGIYASIAIFGPTSVGSGSYIETRVELYAWIFLFLAVAGALVKWPRAAANGFAILCCAVALGVLGASLPVLADGNRAMEEFVAIGRHIRPRSTVLTVTVRRSEEEVDTYHHAVDLLYDRDFIDLRDYEATKNYFSLRFQPDRTPVPALVSVKDYEAIPSVFDICRYERRTLGRVDYLLFMDTTGPGAEGRIDGLIGELYGAQLGAYTPVALSATRHITLRLYRRKAGAQPACGAEATGVAARQPGGGSPAAVRPLAVHPNASGAF